MIMNNHQRLFIYQMSSDNYEKECVECWVQSNFDRYTIQDHDIYYINEFIRIYYLQTFLRIYKIQWSNIGRVMQLSRRTPMNILDLILIIKVHEAINSVSKFILFFFFGSSLLHASLTDKFPTSSFTDYFCLQYFSTQSCSLFFLSSLFSFRLFFSSWSLRLHCTLFLNRHSPDSFNIFFLKNIFPAPFNSLIPFNYFP